MVLGDGLIPQALSRRGVASLPLLSTDGFAAAAIAAQGFDPAQPRWTRGMQDLQHQFISKEGVGVRALLSSARHRCFEEQVSFQPGDLAVGGVGVLFHPQQLLPE